MDTTQDAPTFRVIVSLQGRFHGFDLARELQALGLLHRIMTSHPPYHVARWGIPREKVRAIMRYDVLHRVAARLRITRRYPGLLRFIYDGFDRRVSQRIEQTDLVVAWSGMALHTHRRARALGARTVVERGSTHIEFQRDILVEEYARWGIANKGAFDDWMIEKELCEYEEADAIGIPSDFVRQTFIAKGVPEAKLIQVPYGVDLCAFRPGEKSTAGFRAIYAGMLSLRKGLPYLLEAVKCASVKLWLLGAWTEEAELCLDRYKGFFEYHGAVPQNRLSEFYAQADVFVIASIEEGLAMVIPQALACGLPVICTSHTGGADLVEDGVNGFVVPIRDPGAIAERLSTLRDDPERLAAMKHAAVKSVASGHSWSDYGRAIADRYRNLVAMPPTDHTKGRVVPFLSAPQSADP
jgi:glycosyltransferase involved in cell wall biosynthesis